MSKLLRGLILLGALGLVLAVMVLLATRSRSRGALQRYKAELQANGEKLTFAELTRGLLTNAADSHAVITNAAASLRNARFNPGLLEPRKYLQPGQAIVTWREASPVWSKSAGLNNPGTWAEFESQMQPAQGTLQEIRDALKEPALDAGPYTNMLVGRRVNFVAIRPVAQWLMGAAENDLHQRRLEEALRNLEALAALARMERDEYTLVAQMIRVAVAGLGLAVTWEALQAPGWTEPQLERMQKAWEPVDLLDAVEKGFAGERAGGEELFARLRRSRGRQIGQMFRTLTGSGSSAPKRTFAEVGMDYLYFPAYKLTSIDGDEMFYLTCMQGFIGPMRRLESHRPWGEVNQDLRKVGARLNRLGGWPDQFRYFVSALAIPNFTKATERAIHTETERQLTLAAIAVKRFELRRGEMPPRLEALVPEFLTAVPYDYMSAKPLGYHLKADGGCVLYSVGEDGRDDGGDPTPPPGTSSDLWAGRDAVWPSAAAGPGDPPSQPRRKQ